MNYKTLAAPVRIELTLSDSESDALPLSYGAVVAARSLDYSQHCTRRDILFLVALPTMSRSLSALQTLRLHPLSDLSPRYNRGQRFALILMG